MQFQVKKIVSHFSRSFLKLQEINIGYNGISGKAKEVNHFIIEKADAVCLTLYDETTDEFIFVKQFRTGAARHWHEREPWILEPVAGHIDGQEEPEKAAQREGEEETNLFIPLESIVFLCRGYTSAGCSNEMHHHYFAKVDSTQFDFESAHGVDDEDIQVVKLKRDVVMQMIASGEIRTCSAVLGVSMAITLGLVG